MSGDLNESLPLQDLESIWSGSEEDLECVDNIGNIAIFA
jgi:hypothetical protein